MRRLICVLTSIACTLCFAHIDKDFLLWDNAAKLSRLLINDLELEIHITNAKISRDKEKLHRLETLAKHRAITEQEIIDARLNLKLSEAQNRLAQARKTEAQLENAMLNLRRKFEEEDKDDLPKLADLSWRQWTSRYERGKLVHEVSSIELERVQDRWNRLKKLKEKGVATDLEIIEVDYELQEAKETELKSLANVKMLEKNVADALRIKDQTPQTP